MNGHDDTMARSRGEPETFTARASKSARCSIQLTNDFYSIPIENLVAYRAFLKMLVSNAKSTQESIIKLYRLRSNEFVL
jgi:3-dehydroquinate synthase class II